MKREEIDSEKKKKANYRVITQKVGRRLLQFRLRRYLIFALIFDI